IHNLLSPKKHVDKVYEAHLAKEISDEDIHKLEAGVDIGDKKDDGSAYYTLPAKCERAGCDSKNRPVILLTIHEGRFHQVKRMLEAVGNEVLFLRRLSMGAISLSDDLPCGEYRALTDSEIELLKNR
ncbi:MAG: 16S rRNA pseudouridine(516) synthase, partial [Butyrivibrio sp.]|nr:16S rRNA pseudouridine(516) synthase [Butyrivibrio sp.]